MDGSDWVALAGVISTARVALVVPSLSARSARTLAAQQAADAADAEDRQWRRDRRAEVYIDLAVFVSEMTDLLADGKQPWESAVPKEQQAILNARVNAYATRRCALPTIDA